MRNFARRWRSALALAAVALVSTTAVALATPQTQDAGAQQYQYEKKETICHHTGSKQNPTVTILVSSNAVPAHLAHGDTLGPCPR